MATIPTDPLFSQQRHLRNTLVGQLDLNIIDVWDDYTGVGVQVKVFDDGFDYFHDDLDGNYLTAIDFDYTSNDFTPLPSASDDNHGTAVMGIIGAERGNGYGGVGVAWDVDLVGYRGFNIGTSVADDQFLDAAGLGNGVGNTNGDGDGADVINMSGGRGRFVFLDGTGYDDALDALETIHESGRGGLGTIFVKSSGNSRAPAGSTLREEGTAERYDSTEYSISVAALRLDGWVTNYSTPGANVLISAFADNTSNGGAIVTTDRTGTPGYNTGDFRTNFDGTSAAAPQIAGVVALMLDANDDLGWRDVQNILAYSARHVGSAVGSNANTGAPAGGGFEQGTVNAGDSWFWNDATDWNGGGLHFSNDYGFGLVDALAAVRLAEVWTDIETAQTSANDVVASQDMDGFGVTTTYSSSFVNHTATETTNMEIEFVTVNIDFDIDDLADMEIFIISPTGTRVQMLNDTGDTQALDTDWDFMTNAFRGEESAGSWTVQIRNDDGSGNGTLVTTDVDLEFKGSAITSNDHYIFTNEYSDYDGVAGHVTSFDGTGTGVNTINAAAVTSASTINLLTNNGTIDGVAVSLLNIDRVYTGDGNDTITGDGVSSFLSGGRGNDTITGGSNLETIRGGDGNDVIFGSGNGDELQGDDGNDTFAYDPNITVTDTIVGGVGSDKIRIDDTGTADFTGASVLLINEVEYLAGGGSGGSGTVRTATFNANQFGGFLGLGISTSLLVDGNDGGSTDILRINMNTSTSFSADPFTFSGTFANNADGDYIYIVGDGASETITGSDRADSIVGNSGQDTINGGAGDDTLRAGSGTDTVNAGSGDDLILIANNFIDSVSGGAGSDTLDMSGSTAASTAVTLVSLSGTSTYTGLGGTRNINSIETFIGTQADDDLTAGGADDTTIDGQGGDDMIRGGSFRQSLSGGNGNDTIDGGLYVGSGVGDDIDGGAGNDSLIGANGADTIAGGSGNDSIDSNGGVDTVEGGIGNDTIRGGTGIDDVFGDSGNDTIIINNNEQIDNVNGGAGTDLLDLSGIFSGAQAVTINMDTGTFTGFGGTTTITSIENVIGTQGDDFLRIDQGPIVILGAGMNTIDGQGGDDTLQGGSFEDSILGGSGNDLIQVLGTEFIDNVDGEAGIDTLDHSAMAASGVGAFIGADINFVTGIITTDRASGGTATVAGIEIYRDNNAGNTIHDRLGQMTIYGNGGDDTIIESVSGGNDNFLLGSGNDVLEINNSGIGGDSFNGGTGTDLIDFSNVTLADDAYINLTAGTLSLGMSSEIIVNFENVIGSQGNEFIQGTNGNNTIEGEGGNDTLRGADGADVLDGGSGSDYTDYLGNLTGLTVDLQFAVNNTGIAAGDTFTSIENIRGTNFDDSLRGDAGSNTIDARVGDDILYGRIGNDHLLGGSGNDWLFGGDGADTLDGGTGRDRAAYGDAGGAGVLADLANAALNTGFAMGDVYISIEDLAGSSGSDNLRGNSGDNRLIGANGNDFLYGRDGDDTLEGGGGDDVFFGGAGGDILSGSVGRDIASYADTATGIVVDLANVAVNTGYAAGDTYSNIEVIIGSGGDDDIRGDAGDNQLEGRNGDDFLTGRNGDDDLRGGNGNDVLIGGVGADRHVGGSGIDTASYTDTNTGMTIDLVSNGLNTGIAAGDGYNGIENIAASGGNDDVRGDNGANWISGRNGDDFIFARGGDDTLLGGNGDDNLRGGSGGDILNGGAGTDSANYIDSVGLKADLQFAGVNTGVAAGDSYVSVENLFGSNGDDDLRGDNGDNSLVGRDGVDFLTGRDGDDDLRGGAGDDVLRGGNGADVLAGNAGDDNFRFDAPSEGIDTILDFQINRDTILLDDAGFSSLSAGSLSASNFRMTGTPADADDYIIYDAGSGALYYDADGAGGAAAVRFATLANSAAIDENDFYIV